MKRRKTNQRHRICALAAYAAILLLASFAKAEILYDGELDIAQWAEEKNVSTSELQVLSPEEAFKTSSEGSEIVETSWPEEVTSLADDQGFVAGYIYLNADRNLFGDERYTTILGHVKERSVVYAKRIGDAASHRYRLTFDTEKSRETAQPVTAYATIAKPAALDEGEKNALIDALQIAGARVKDGIPLTTVRIDPNPVERESQFAVQVWDGGPGEIARSETNLRKGPGTEYDYVTRLAKGTAVEILGSIRGSDGGEWLKVQSPTGEVGFVMRSLVVTLADQLQAEDTQVTSEPETTPIPTPMPATEPEAFFVEATPTPKEEPIPAEETEKSVSIRVLWQDEAHELGSTAVLEAVLEGYENAAVALQWQQSVDGISWWDVHGATQESLTLTMTQENQGNLWRLLVTEKSAG